MPLPHDARYYKNLPSKHDEYRSTLSPPQNSYISKLPHFHNDYNSKLNNTQQGVPYGLCLQTSKTSEISSVTGSFAFQNNYGAEDRHIRDDVPDVHCIREEVSDLENSHASLMSKNQIIKSADDDRSSAKQRIGTINGNYNRTEDLHITMNKDATKFAQKQQIFTTSSNDMSKSSGGMFPNNPQMDSYLSRTKHDQMNSSASVKTSDASISSKALDDLASTMSCFKPVFNDCAPLHKRQDNERDELDPYWKVISASAAMSVMRAGGSVSDANFAAMAIMNATRDRKDGLDSDSVAKVVANEVLGEMLKAGSSRSAANAASDSILQRNSAELANNLTSQQSSAGDKAGIIERFMRHSQYQQQDTQLKVREDNAAGRIGNMNDNDLNLSEEDLYRRLSLAQIEMGQLGETTSQLRRAIENTGNDYKIKEQVLIHKTVQAETDKQLVIDKILELEQSRRKEEQMWNEKFAICEEEIKKRSKAVKMVKMILEKRKQESLTRDEEWAKKEKMFMKAQAEFERKNKELSNEIKTIKQQNDSYRKENELLRREAKTSRVEKKNAHEQIKLIEMLVRSIEGDHVYMSDKSKEEFKLSEAIYDIRKLKLALEAQQQQQPRRATKVSGDGNIETILRSHYDTDDTLVNVYAPDIPPSRHGGTDKDSSTTGESPSHQESSTTSNETRPILPGSYLLTNNDGNVPSTDLKSSLKQSKGRKMPRIFRKSAFAKSR